MESPDMIPLRNPPSLYTSLCTHLSGSQQPQALPGAEERVRIPREGDDCRGRWRGGRGHS